MIRIFIIVGVVLAAICIWAMYKEQTKWEKFAVQHNCKIVSEAESKTAVTGKGDLVIIPGSKTYLCDDGVKYTRSN